MGFPGGSAVKNPPAKQNTRDLTPGSGRAPGEEIGNLLQYLWEIPWTEEPVGYSPWGCRRIGRDLATKHQQKEQMRIMTTKIMSELCESFL